MSTARDYFTLTRAKDVMTREVVTIAACQQMSAAAQKLREHHISGVPVVSKEGICMGVLTTKNFNGQGECDSDPGQVMSHMTSPAITVSEDHSLLDVAAILRSSRIHRVPVVDDHGHVVGILSTLDIVTQTLKAMEVESEATMEAI